jgi:cyanuric acid amidohydrolase
VPHARIHRLAMRGPNDTNLIESVIRTGNIDPASIVAILGKTEGNGCVNDFTRGYAVQSLRLMLARHLDHEAIDRIAFVMSGGTEGGLAPHWIVVESLAGDHRIAGPALAVGSIVTRALAPEEIGKGAQIDVVAQAVETAMSTLGISNPDDVHFVQIKCPLLTAERVADARERGFITATTDTLKSMGLSRGASALGVAVALGELKRSAIQDAAIGTDRMLYSTRASTSAGVELLAHEIVVMGMSQDWTGPLRIDHAVMADGLDVEPVRAALERLGLGFPGQIPAAHRDRLVALLAKAEAPTSGRLRDHRHTMLDDSDISSTRHARGFVAGALGALVGHAELFVSGGAEHQGPDGGGPIAVIVATSKAS